MTARLAHGHYSNSRAIGLPHVALLWAAVWGAPPPRYVVLTVIVAVVATLNFVFWHLRTRALQSLYFGLLIGWFVMRGVSVVQRNGISVERQIYSAVLFVVLGWDLYRLWLRRAAEGI